RDHIEMQFNTECVIDPVPIDINFAFEPARRQYNSTSILAHLKATTTNSVRALLAVVSDDIYAAGLNFVFGEAEVGGRVAIISLARLSPSFWGEPNSQDILQTRAR